MSKTGLQIISFKSQKIGQTGLPKIIRSRAVFGCGFFKKDSEVASVTYAEALDEALC